MGDGDPGDEMPRIGRARTGGPFDGPPGLIPGTVELKARRALTWPEMNPVQRFVIVVAIGCGAAVAITATFVLCAWLISLVS